jgi:hypothetical protein
MPSLVRSVLVRTTRICASTIWLPRSLLTRNIRVGVPSHGAIVTCFENAMRAFDCENFANTSPVETAVTSRPTTASTTTSAFAVGVSGYIEPYPIVPIVCTLKKNASVNEPGLACAIPPVVM